ncbi:hypothetical protein [Bacterioplanes sanyensis]|uniref:hypothetical protein n=1 Tax=Bacterioplanes sanyensis TaxID=1249553 RepID=UPI0022B93035|nr:hypothetical protein [Bacterioplanes sanyensis]
MTDLSSRQKVLVINCGSSSIKCALYANPEATTPQLTALAERLGSTDAQLTLGEHTAAIPAPTTTPRHCAHYCSSSAMSWRNWPVSATESFTAASGSAPAPV